MDGFVSLTDYYANHAISHFGLPPERVHRIPMGIHAHDFAEAAEPLGETFTIGYLARICPEKGLHKLCEAFMRLRQAGTPPCRLRAAGYLGSGDRAYFDELCARLRQSGAHDAFEYVGEVSRADKIRFLRSLHVLAAPTTYRESKGFYVIEALAAGVPVVLPDHGAFPEIVAATDGGLLHEPDSTESLSERLAELAADPTLRQRLSTSAIAAARSKFSADEMATQAWQLFRRFVQCPESEVR